MDYYESAGDAIVVEALDDSYTTLATANNNIVEDFEIENASIYTQLRNDIAALSAYEAFHTVMKQALHYELKNTRAALDQNDLNTLASIAYLCPLSHGTGVYMAQALLLGYNALDINLIGDNCDTDFATFTNAKDDFITFGAEVYPNPTTGVFRIEANLPDYELIVYQNGRAIMSSKGTKVVDLSEYANGVYQVKLISGKGVLVKQIDKSEIKIPIAERNLNCAPLKLDNHRSNQKNIVENFMKCVGDNHSINAHLSSQSPGSHYLPSWSKTNLLLPNVPAYCQKNSHQK